MDLVFRFISGVFLAAVMWPMTVDAQVQPGHWLDSSDAAPGAIGRRRLLQGEPQSFGSQPVRILVPEGAIVEPPDASPSPESLYEATSGRPGSRSQLTLGIQFGQAYRVVVRGIPGLENTALYPSIELLDRLTPPVGKELDFPIPLELTQQELRDAAAGNFVIKVVYVEDPNAPIQGAGTKEDILPYFEVMKHEDPLHLADVLGRPVAMIRVGAAQPPEESTDASGFFFGYPPTERFDDDREAVRKLVGYRRSSAPMSRLVSAELANCRQPMCDVTDPAVAFGTPLEAPCYRKPPRSNRDEFICDGGDEELLARVDNTGKFAGLSESDTVASYQTPSGARRVVASSKACVYSPRFAAARKIVHLEVHELAQLAGGVEHHQAAENANTADARKSMTSYLMAERNSATKVMHAVQDRLPSRLVDRVLSPEERNQGEVPWQQVWKTKAGLVRDVDRLAIQIGRHNALEWSSALELQIMLDEEEALDFNRVRGANEGVLYESGEGAQLQLIKTASQPDADLGEVVSFSLQFKNAGPEPIGQLVIVDNLPIRLEYVEGSQESTRHAQFSTEGNSGTTLLKWIFAEPLNPGDEGVITFDCKVR
jgi:uncharacterized repeat protein (TIGR01451 family)